MELKLKIFMAGEDISGFGRWTWPTRHRIGMISPSAAYQCAQSVPAPEDIQSLLRMP